MNEIDSIIIHCSATKAGQDLRAKDIDRMHRQRGFTQIGYNFVIDLDGTVENGRHCLLTELTVIPKDSPGYHTTNTQSVSATLADWIQMVGRLIQGRMNRRILFVTL